MPHIQAACPCQFALSTRAGTEAVIKALATSTELDHHQTILSVDGVGAFDHISRTSMLHGLLQVLANRCLPFVRSFYGTPSHYVWHDAEGNPHTIEQTEGGKRGGGDPLMPALYCLGAAAIAIQ